MGVRDALKFPSLTEFLCPLTMGSCILTGDMMDVFGAFD